MPIALDARDEPLETALTALGKKQPRPLSKTAMLRAVAWAAVRVCQMAGDPMAWEAASLSTRNDLNSSQPANKSVQTDQVPATKQVSDREEDDAGTRNPPASELSKSANSSSAQDAPRESGETPLGETG